MEVDGQLSMGMPPPVRTWGVCSGRALSVFVLSWHKHENETSFGGFQPKGVRYSGEWVVWGPLAYTHTKFEVSSLSLSGDRITDRQT